MAPKPAERAIFAIEAMKKIGIDPKLTKAALRKLVPQFNYNWELIEDENYWALADLIFEMESSKVEPDECSKKGEPELNLRGRLEERPLFSSHHDTGATSLSKPHEGESLRRKRHMDRNDDDVDQTMPEMKKESDSCLQSSKECQISSPHDDSGALTLRRPVLGSVERKVQSCVQMRMDQDVRNNGKETETSIKMRMDQDVHSKRKQAETSIKMQMDQDVCIKKKKTEASSRRLKERQPSPPHDNSGTLILHSSEHATEPNRRAIKIDPNDLTNGQEMVQIKLVCDMHIKLPSFRYISQNITFKNAHVNISLDRIGDENCCPDCTGDCLRAQLPCACARETGGEYAYTSEGLIREDFLDSCISRNQTPKEHHIYYCKECPLERIKNEIMPEQCKGHIIKRFIKECWSKCGCNRKCGNRVVQRGITCDLQVYYIGKRKGWGLRTTRNLPKGTFICEYVGEVLTNMELFDRTMNDTCNDKHTYPVILDADWACEQVLEDEDALCLDATYYGNVARFVNHSCDPNLVAIPVEVETPDHHYYHLAFFTRKKIEADEELCWDYGIDFDDDSHPIKAFTCLCGSKICRDKNVIGTKPGASVGK